MTEVKTSVADMKSGQTAVILGFSDDEISVKLMEMGFYPARLSALILQLHLAILFV
jgi:FeoA domain.